MSVERRIERLDRQLPPEEPPFTFEVVVPPDGLSRADREEWCRQQQAECEAEGVIWFTMNLGDCDVRGEEGW